MFCSHVRMYVCMYACIHQELLKNLCVCAHLVNKANSDSDLGGKDLNL